MTASTEMQAAFTTWSLAELAAHHAEPCPDEVMSALVENTSTALARLASSPAVTCEDLVLKLFPVFLADFEPKCREHPLVPNYDNGACPIDADGFAAILADFQRLVPAISGAMAPSSWRRARAA